MSEQPIDLDTWKRAADWVRNCDVPQMRVVTADPEEVDAIIGEVERLRGRLRELEWAGTLPWDAGDGRRCCPVCDASDERHEDHAADCWLAVEIGREGR